jgi:hypothetical protein
MEQVVWETGTLVSAKPSGGKMILTFGKPMRVDDFGSEIEGFSLAGQDGTYFMAEAVYPEIKDKNERFKQLIVSSPMVPEPVTVRYAWSRAPMGNLKVNGIPWQPLHSFRTDQIAFSPEVTHQDPDGGKKNSEAVKNLKAAASEALKTRLKATPK